MSNPTPEKKTPEQMAADVKVAIEAAKAKAAATVENTGQIAATQAGESARDMDQEVIVAAKAAGVTTESLEAVIAQILDKRKAATIDKLTPKEPDYKELNEADIYSQDVYIPVIEHELPDYMNMKLRDSEYVPVWANKDQRRLGALLAEGYEVLEKKHVDSSFTPPLKFTSEGTYEYQDVICLRVHKRIRFAKLRRIQQVSQNQLKPVNAKANAKAKLVEDVIANDPSLDVAFGTGKFAFYETTTSNK